MTQAKQGDVVLVHYTGTLTDGHVFDSSREREPIEFEIGQRRLIPGFEDAVVGMKVGDTRKITLAPENAYGPYREELVATVERNLLPPDLEPEVGMMLQVNAEGGQIVNVTVREIGEESITLDGNHALAGQPLEFDIELVQVR